MRKGRRAARLHLRDPLVFSVWQFDCEDQRCASRPSTYHFRPTQHRQVHTPILPRIRCKYVAARTWGHGALGSCCNIRETAMGLRGRFRCFPIKLGFCLEFYDGLSVCLPIELGCDEARGGAGASEPFTLFTRVQKIFRVFKLIQVWHKFCAALAGSAARCPRREVRCIWQQHHHQESRCRSARQCSPTSHCRSLCGTSLFDWPVCFFKG